MDVQVMRGASCWTDHLMMVRARVLILFLHSVGA